MFVYYNTITMSFYVYVNVNIQLFPTINTPIVVAFLTSSYIIIYNAGPTQSNSSPPTNASLNFSSFASWYTI